MNGIICQSKLCGRFVAYSLKLTPEASLLGGKFSEFWKLANVLPVHKKKNI